MTHTAASTHPPLLPVSMLTAGMVLSGTVGVLVVESGAPPVVAAFWRCLIGAVALSAVIAARGDERRSVLHLATTRQGVPVAVSGILLVSNWVLLFTAYSHLSIGIATVVFHVEPFLLIGLGAIFLGERVTFRVVAWAALGFGGIVLVAQPWAAGVGELRGLLTGMGFALAAALLYAGSIVLVRRVQSDTAHPGGPLAITTVQLLAGTLLTAPAVVLVPYQGSAGGWLHLAALGLIDTGFMYCLIYGSYPRLGTATIGVLSFVYPAAAVVVDFFAYGTLISVTQMLGFAAIAGAGIGHVLTQTPASHPR